MTKKVLKNTTRISTIVLHNENNFLNRGDILHKALKMLNNRWWLYLYYKYSIMVVL